MSAVVEVEGGGGRGNRWTVASDGGGSTFPAMSSVRNLDVTVTTAGTQIVDVVPADEQRRQIQIQNLSATIPVHINLGAGTPTTSHYRIDPGATYSFANGVSYNGEIVGLSVGGSAVLAVIEFFNE